MTTEQMDIARKAKELYFRYGIKSVTMDDVARELGISKKTLYQHYSDKAELVEASVLQELAGAEKTIEALIADCADAIDEMLVIHKFMDKMARTHSYAAEYDLKKYYPALYSKVIKVKRDSIYSIWKSNMEKGKQSGHYRMELNTEIIAKMNLLRVESTMDTCILTTEELLSQDFFTEMFIYHIRGIGTPKGISRMEELLILKQ
jgi:AcrR family transcriptional regulator